MLCSLLGIDWIFALATCMELVVACPCALASVMNFAWGSGEGYSVGSLSLPRGSIYHQSPVSPPKLFRRISNSYKCCLSLEWPPSLQTSHLLRNDNLKKGVKNSSQMDSKMLSNVYAYVCTVNQIIVFPTDSKLLGLSIKCLFYVS